MEAHKVGVRELKNHLTHWLRRVRDGETVLVTDRGKVVAEIRPNPGAATVPSWLQRLADEGIVVQMGAANDPSAYPTMPAVGPPGLAQQLLDEDREDRL